MTEHSVYTIGYGNDTPAQFMVRLLEAGIELVIDIRRNGSRARLGSYYPSTDRQKGVWKLLADSGIDYRWMPEFGNEFKVTENRPIRETLLAYSIWLDMKVRLRELQAEFFTIAMDCFRKKTALLCAEKDIRRNGRLRCHRYIFAQKVAEELVKHDGYEWDIINL